MLEEDPDVRLGLRVMDETRRQYAQRAAEGHEPDHVLVSSRYRPAIARAISLVHGRKEEPYWIRITDYYAIQIVFSPDLPDVYVPTSESAERHYETRTC